MCLTDLATEKKNARPEPSPQGLSLVILMTSLVGLVFSDRNELWLELSSNPKA